MSPEIETKKIVVLHEDESKQFSKKAGSRRKENGRTKSTIPGYSPYIAAIAADFPRELGDAVHAMFHVKQALNLWQSAGLVEEDFVDLMQEARKLTRKYQSRPTWDGMNNKMAYLFTTLRRQTRIGDSDSLLRKQAKRFSWVVTTGCTWRQG